MFRQSCGELVHRIALMDAAGLITPVISCSSDIPNPGYTATDFGFSRLSPDATKIAAEVVIARALFATECPLLCAARAHASTALVLPTP